MTDWTTAELDRVDGADELQITTARRDGSLRSWVPIWAVRVGNELFVRSYRGTDGAWYRHATQLPNGRIRANGMERGVAFDSADENFTTAVDEAYRAKYARYGSTYLRPMLAEQARAATLRLTPRD
jgi:hypothetical protein